MTDENQDDVHEQEQEGHDVVVEGKCDQFCPQNEFKLRKRERLVHRLESSQVYVLLGKAPPYQQSSKPSSGWQFPAGQGVLQTRGGAAEPRAARGPHPRDPGALRALPGGHRHAGAAPHPRPPGPLRLPVRPPPRGAAGHGGAGRGGGAAHPAAAARHLREVPPGVGAAAGRHAHLLRPPEHAAPAGHPQVVPGAGGGGGAGRGQGAGGRAVCLPPL